jgi:hypothetical protein
MIAAPRSLLGEALLVTWALVLYYLVTHQRLLHDEGGYQAYGFAALLFVTLTVWGLGRIALALFRAARRDDAHSDEPGETL